ncbi:UDP-N-acetylmuramoyl-L-alanyl-D-glutamate--L-lysine ligase [Candidatus Enterococcus murrayae]|uniref:UDP-N-acetylmuramoyl-L-alanyl-D-glutamate--L-lysine ligase n=1 Tax=Candidatus Enterococcus murrayae TaxID=2815321 RepID=A0ABS3HIQ0_9ENTE|nr:UDP-N-acetylmuramoyl-L-alanyl-D-glutamate--L-lysine ligase [Enterococcus sp. MJM16]MBO0453340.1 UDP-N-acetylmuramoyl-L-alanyl-D-glutamate--L-lysine ligase [Enterococcus sp. MJM16]
MLTLTQIQQILEKENLLREFITPTRWTLSAPFDKSYQKISYDSREVDSNTLFFCKGNNFQQRFLEQALADGLTSYIAEQPYEVPAELAIIVTDIRQALAVLSMAFYDYPQEKLKLIGITGTKGKTTVAYFTKQILDIATNKKTALLSTLNTTLDGVTFFKSKLTTPESLDLYRMMAEAAANGMTHLVMEVSSQAYKVARVYGLTFDVGLFLNISPDHIGPIEHPTFEDYFYCKRQLVANSRQVILQHEIDHFELLQELAEIKNIPVITYGNEAADYYVKPLEHPLAFSLSSSTDQYHLNGSYQLLLAGDFNKENAAAALIAGALVGADQNAGRQGLAEALVPGRMNLLLKPNGAHIYVDYAHNYLSMKSLLAFAKEQHPDGQLLVITGSTGNKAESRREGLGQAIGEYADCAVLTSDDPNFEDPKKIANEIEQSIQNAHVHVQFEADRKKAIKEAIQNAGPNDAIILAGKGTDKYMTVNGKDLPYEGDYHLAEEFIKD